nr:hypothetical protein [Microbacterium kunmingense]
MGAVWPGGVVVLSERVELGLQLADRVRARSCREPAFQGLVEAFDLALGLGVVGGAVLLADVQGCEDVFELVATTAVAGGVDAPVVGEGGGGRPVDVDGREEGVDDALAGDGAVGAAGQQESGVVVEPV